MEFKRNVLQSLTELHNRSWEQRFQGCSLFSQPHRLPTWRCRRQREQSNLNINNLYFAEIGIHIYGECRNVNCSIYEISYKRKTNPGYNPNNPVPYVPLTRVSFPRTVTASPFKKRDVGGISLSNSEIILPPCCLLPSTSIECPLWTVLQILPFTSKYKSEMKQSRNHRIFR